MLQAETEHATDFDTLVVGAGTAGMETALSLGDMGYKVLLVEKEPSVGGKTILLSKVFPTLDCASCISTPKMAASAHHPNVTLLVYSEVDDISRRNDGTFHVKLHRKPTYVDPATCTGCAKCEEACTVAVSDEYNYGLVARRAAHIAFPQAVPKKSVIDRVGSGPCLHTCPAGVKPSGFVSLVRAGRHEDAFRLHLDDAPLVGSLSRACYAPCEGECSRAEMEGPVHIRAIKRFMVDRYYAEHPEPEYGPPETVLDTRVAVVGSGPAGLSAAFHLAKRGHRVTVFEAEPEAGGMLRHGMPAYRMPNDLLDRDIKNITALGVQIKTHTRVESLHSLRDQGFDAVFVGVGGQVPRIVPVHGEDLVDVDDCMTFLRQTNVGELPDLEDKHVVVVGGGNVAMDVARSAARLATQSVSIVCLEARDKMLAHEFEVEEAIEEGVKVRAAAATKRVFTGDDGQTMLEYLAVDSLDFSGGKMDLTTVEGSEQQVPADVVILAVGLGASTAPFEDELELNANKTLVVDEKTCQTSLPHVFAGGDVALGPSIIVEAMGMGRRAAAQIDRYLKNEPFAEPEFEMRLRAADKKAVTKRSAKASRREPSAIRKTPPHERVQSFEAYEGTFTEEEARYAANRCLDCGGCSQCRQCVSACPAGCIDFGMREESMELNVDSVVLSTGYSIMDPSEKPLMGYGKYPNVITAPQMDRLLAPTRPFNGVIRPSDGKEPDNLAFVLCMGSRDHTVCNPLCCRVGCMYSIKHAQLIMGALPLADVTIYYIDIRAFGKGYDEFTEQAKGMGVAFVKGKVSRIEEGEDGNLVLHYEEMAGRKGLQQAEHDMVVLSVGLLPNLDVRNLFKDGGLSLDDFSYVREVDEDTSPARTSIDGVFTAGTVSGARDIPDTVLHSGAAATQAAAYIERLRTA